MTALQRTMLLYVEDDIGQARLVQRRLEKNNYFIELAHNGQDGLARYDGKVHQLILLDYLLPDGDGIQMLKEFKAKHPDHAPIIILTAGGSEKVAVEALKLGAADYMIKDTNHAYIELLPTVMEGVLFMRELIRQNQNQQEELSFYARELEKRNEILRTIAYHDSLCGLSNKVMFDVNLEKTLARAKRHKETFYLLLIDLDNFRSINKSFTPMVGDQVLKQVGQRISSVVRDSDSVYRVGGDEFVIVLEGITNEKGASLVAQKVLDHLDLPYEIDPNISVNASASIGIAGFPANADNAKDLTRCMYEASRLAKFQREPGYYIFDSDPKAKTRAKKVMVGKG